MSVVWDRGHATVQDVKDALGGRRPLAYTTIMTVMGRLVLKGVLRRSKKGRAYVYTAAIPKEKMAGSMLQSLVRRLYGAATGSAIAHLLQNEPVDEAELDRLEALIRARRQARK